ncbi:hypothetical protein O3P69_003767 [Scylla paramamosain]|uniref:Peptidase S1 domain-containing protein n=1 Tax=Scylla paramamosain TaxID=85552 RepID=A0AAW0UE17_SCYPA
MLRSENHMGCGVSKNKSPDIAGRIVGGITVHKNEIPWQISLQLGKRHVCGAVVIDRLWVTSAAHCLNSIDIKELHVVAGEHHLETQDLEQRREVKEAIAHPNFDPTTNENDIALLLLAKPLKLDGLTVNPVCLPPFKANVTGFCEVSGWGFTKEGGARSNILKKVAVPIISDADCRTHYDKTPRKVTDSMICAGFTEGKKDACQADSGGPADLLGPRRPALPGGIGVVGHRMWTAPLPRRIHRGESLR